MHLLANSLAVADRTRWRELWCADGGRAYDWPAFPQDARRIRPGTAMATRTCGRPPTATLKTLGVSRCSFWRTVAALCPALEKQKLRYVRNVVVDISGGPCLFPELTATSLAQGFGAPMRGLHQLEELSFVHVTRQAIN